MFSTSSNPSKGLRKARSGVAFVSLMALVAACGAATDAGKSVEHGNVPSRPLAGWDLFNQPELVAGARGYTTRLDELPTKGELARKPWRGAFWAHQTGGIAFRWLAADPQNFTYTPPPRDAVMAMSLADRARLSPAEKADILQGRFDYPTVAREWGRTGPRSLPWEGLCDGLAVAQLLYDEPQPVLLRSAEGIDVPFGSADVKALLALDKGFSHRPQQSIVGIQCVSQNAAADTLCKEDMNAGTFHVVLANQIGLRQEGFLADVDWGEEVWNHVLYGYESTLVSESGPSPGAAPGTAKEQRMVTTVRQSLIRPPAWAGEPANDDLDGYVRYEYVLEVSAQGRIVGGRWISDEHPDFLWTIASDAEEKAKLDPLVARVYEASLRPAVRPPDPGVEPTPVGTPTVQPTALPTVAPTAQPTALPTVAPTAQPTVVPTAAPTAQPTVVPTAAPTAQPTVVPTAQPTPLPTPQGTPIAQRDLQHLRTLLSQISARAQSIGAAIRNTSRATHLCDIQFRYSTYKGNEVAWADSDVLRGVEIYAGTEASPTTRVPLPEGHKIRSVQTLARCEGESVFAGVPIVLRP